MTQIARVSAGAPNTLVGMPLSLVQLRIPPPPRETDSRTGRDPRDMARDFAESVRLEPVQSARVVIVPLVGGSASSSPRPDPARAIEATTDDRGSILLEDGVAPLFAPSEYLVFWTYHQEIYDEVIEALADPERATTVIRERAFQHFTFAPETAVGELELPLLGEHELPSQIAVLLASVRPGPMGIVRHRRRFGPRSSAVIVEQVDHHYALIDRSMPFVATYVAEFVMAYATALLASTAPEWALLAHVVRMIDIERRGLPPDIVGNPERSFARADVYAAYHQYALAAARSPDVDRRAFCQSLGSTITGGMGLAEAGARSVLAQSAGRAVHPSSIGETDHASGSARFTRDEIVIGPQFVDMFVHYFDFYRLAIRERAAGMTDISQRVIGDQERELDRLRAWCASLLETHVAEAPLWIRLWEHTRAADDAFEMWNRCSAVRLELGHHFYRRVASEIGEDGLFRRAMSAIASAADNGAQLFSASCEQFCRNIETIRDIRAADVGDFVRTFYGYHGAMTGQRLELPGLEQSRLIVDLAEGRVHIDSGTSRSLAFEFLTTGGDESWPRATSSAAPAEPTWHRYTGDERVRIVEHERYSLEHVPAALHGVVATAQIISTALAFQQVTTELSAQNVRTCVDLGQGVLGTMESAASFLAVIATRHHDYYEPVSRLLRMPGAHPSAALARAASGLGRVATVLGIGAMAYDGAMIFFSRSGDLQHALDRGDDVAALAARTRGGIYVVAAIVETGGLVAALAGASGPWLVIASAVLGLTVVAVDVVALLANGGADHLEELQSAYYDAKRAELFGGERETSLRNLQPRTLDRLRRLSTALRALGS